MFPQQIGRFEINATLGENKRGKVFRAYDPQLQRDVAVKLLNSQFLYTLTSERKFKEQADRLTALNHHGIVPVYGYGDEDNRPFFVTELMEGGDFNARLLQGPLPPEEVITTFIPIAEALDYAASRDIIHHDIKPSNIMFDHAGRPRLADLGLLQTINAVATVHAPSTNPEYISPEQVRKRKLDGRVHVYSLGALIYQALTGQPLFKGPSTMVTMFKHTSERPRAPRSLNPALSEAVEDVLLQAVEKRAEERYSSCGAFLRALDTAVQTSMGGQPASPRPVAYPSAPPVQQYTPEYRTPPAQPVYPAPEIQHTPQSRAGASSKAATFVVLGIVAVLLFLGVCMGATFFLINESSSSSDSLQPDIGPTSAAITTQIVADSLAANARAWPIVLTDAFDENTNDWMEGTDENGYATITFAIDSEYQWTARAQQAFIWRIWPSMDDKTDFYLAVDAQQMSGPVNGQYGLIFRNSGGANNYYFFEVRDDGYFRLLLFYQGEWHTLIDETWTSAIHAGERNRLEVVGKGAEISLWINGEYVGSALDNRLRTGNAGLAVGLSNAGEEISVIYDNFEVRAPLTPSSSPSAQPLNKTTPEPVATLERIQP